MLPVFIHFIAYRDNGIPRLGRHASGGTVFDGKVYIIIANSDYTSPVKLINNVLMHTFLNLKFTSLPQIINGEFISYGFLTVRSLEIATVYTRRNG